MWSSSSAWRRSASGVVVTSTPCSLRPAAIAGSQCSSRWKRIVRGIGLPCRKELFELRRGRLRLHLLDESTLVLDGGVNLVSVVVVVGKGRVHLGEGNRGVSRGDLGRRHPHLLVPDGNVPHLDSVPEDVGLPAAVAGADPNVLGDDGQG